MKVARYHTLGGPEHIEVAEQSAPTPAEGQLLVRVHATSVNPVDWKMASGAFPFNLMPPALPYVPGFDVAGEVERAAGGFAVGDRVFVRKTERAGGASAELAVCDAGVAAAMPAGMSFHDAAAIPLAGMTALQGLRDGARLPLSGADGWRVLIVGASGGVGHFATQIARDAGAHVTGVCSARNADFVASLGAHAVIDYARDDAWNAAGNFDVILDCVGGKPVSRFTPLLTARGAYACVMPGAGVFARQLVSALAGPACAR
ncbi:MAG: NAD(P)-dependent alcohol dehydrogenase [Polyangiales bacterium]